MVVETNYTAGVDPRTQKQRDMSQLEAMRAERMSWEAQWKDINEIFLPRSARFFVEDVNDGRKRHNRIIDNTPIRALRIMAAGMMAGATSPARPWFRLQTADPEMNNYQPVREWLDDVARLILRGMARSDAYRMFAHHYVELGAYGTSCVFAQPDFHTLLSWHPVTIGEYFIAQDYRGKVHTVIREFQKTVGEIVGEFGYERCSPTVKRHFDHGSHHEWITIIHVVEPRRTRRPHDAPDNQAVRDPSRIDTRNMPWRSAYFEKGAPDEMYLRESGFERFPYLVPRWDTIPGDVYGGSPAMEALGDARQLQHQQKRKGQAIDYMTKPVMQMPTQLKGKQVALLPGSKNYHNQQGQGGGMRPAWQPNLAVGELTQDMIDVRQRLQAPFFADLFLTMHLGRDDPTKTATEIAALQAEKLLMLGPVLGHIEHGLQAPSVMMAYEQLLAGGGLPPTPPEMEGMAIDIEFIGMLAQAQKSIGVNAMDRYTGALLTVAGSGREDVLDNVDWDDWATEMGDSLGVPPKIQTSEQEREEIRAQRAQQIQQQQQAEQLAAGAGAIRDLAAADTEGPNALNDAASAVGL